MYTLKITVVKIVESKMQHAYSK